ncbi:hypothetical protein KRX54_02160, partial [Actinomycetaceae bacterium TAE3-ERU4]|nr:hypothetical protein [Actinomycetaceae bacterium TAE3-ERU4]
MGFSKLFFVSGLAVGVFFGCTPSPAVYAMNHSNFSSPLVGRSVLSCGVGDCVGVLGSLGSVSSGEDLDRVLVVVRRQVEGEGGASELLT